MLSTSDRYFILGCTFIIAGVLVRADLIAGTVCMVAAAMNMLSSYFTKRKQEG